MSQVSLASIATQCLTLYESTRTRSALETSINLARRVVNGSQSEDASRLMDYLLLLANGLLYQMEYDTRDEVFAEAARAAREAIGISERSSESHLFGLGILSKIYWERFQVSGERGDLEMSIRYAQEIASLTDDKDPEKPIYMCNLSTLMAELFKGSRLIEHANSAVQTAQNAEALVARSMNKQHEAFCAATTGAVGLELILNNIHWADHDLLEEAINKIRWAINHIRIEGSNNQDLSRWKHHLALLLEIRFERTGNMKALDEAIALIESSANEGTHSNRTKARRLNALGNMFGRKFEWTGESELLESAIKSLEDAKELSLDLRSAERAAYLNNLAYVLAARFHRQGKIEDLTGAIRYSRLACDASQGHPDLVTYMNSLANHLRALHEQQPQNREHLEEALKAARKARELISTGSGNPLQATCANNLAIILMYRFELFKESDDFEGAVRFFEEARHLRQTEDPDRINTFLNLGNLYYLESEYMDTRKALQYFLEAWQCAQGQALNRVKAAMRALCILREQKNWRRARDIGNSALQLLPDVCNRFLGLNDQQHVISQTAGLAADVCSLYLQENQAVAALQKLEFGRGLILGYMIDRCSDVSALEREYPGLAAEYAMLRFQTSHTMHDALNASHRQRLITSRREARKNLDRVLAQIRSKPGHESFLLEPSIDELARNASDGEIVVVNATDIRADAIVVNSHGIRSIELVQMKEGLDMWATDREYKRYRSMTAARSTHYRDVEPESTQVDNTLILEWLWETCVKPVLTEVSSQYCSSGEYIPRLWWIGTGIASSLPFHAAGYYGHQRTETALHKTISSYTPSIKALGYSRSLSAKQHS